MADAPAAVNRSQAGKLSRPVLTLASPGADYLTSKLGTRLMSGNERSLFRQKVSPALLQA